MDYNEHQKLGAKFTAFGGWDMPVQYTSITEEHAAVRTHAGIFDTSHMGVILVKGPQSVAFLKLITPADIDRLVPGQAKYSFFLNENGGIVDDLIIYARSNDYLLVINAGNREKDMAWVMDHLIHDMAVEDLSDQICLLSIQGPAAQKLLQPLVYENLSAIKYFHYLPAMFEPLHLAMTIARTGYTGEDGFELFVPVAHAAAVWQLIAMTGARPCGLGCRDTLRLEACMPLHGHEISDTITPLEAKLERSICWQNDFIGKQALLKQKETGLSSFLTACTVSDGIPRAGYEIRINEVPAGLVTSGTFSPTKKTGIALGYINRPVAAADKVTIVIHNQPRLATIVPMPFYKRNK